MEPIRLGVIGTGRGKSFMHPADCTGFKLCAICDTSPERLAICKKAYDTDGNLKTYTDFDEMINSGEIDAVVLANYFNEHAPFAIKALKAGLHVMSECAAIGTLAEGVELARTVEQTGKIYMIAENYPFNKNRLEMKRLYESGEIGEIMYGEGEYCHPMDVDTTYRISPGEYHWRNQIPSTYYCTHAIAPVMYITNTVPKRVTGMAVRIKDQSYRGLELRQQDPGGIILCQMDNGAVVRTVQGAVRVSSGITSVYGTKGGMEIDRETGMLTVWHSDVNRSPFPSSRTYSPGWPEHGDLAARAGHGGGDFWTLFYFGEAIRKNEQPWLNVYRACAMSSIGILAWKSIVSNGQQFAVPDFADEEDRKKYENDNWTPFLKEGEDPATKPVRAVSGWKPSPEAHEAARKIWEERHYWGLGWDGSVIDESYAKIKT
jgi:predicted dehydrogenase